MPNGAACAAAPRGSAREYDVPSERTFRRLLKKVDSEELKDVLVSWMAGGSGSAPSGACGRQGGQERPTGSAPFPRPAGPAAAAEPCEIPPELQKPKADKALMLVNFQTTEQRLVDQVAVPRDTNEEAAVAAHLPKMDLAGVCLTPMPPTPPKPIAAN
jgi:hypothetical protein